MLFFLIFIFDHLLTGHSLELAEKIESKKFPRRVSPKSLPHVLGIRRGFVEVARNNIMFA